MRSRRRRQRIAGVVPRVGRGAIALGRRIGSHPQPFIVLSVLVVGVWALWGSAQRADAFRITRVTLPAEPSFRLREPLVGTLLWQLDIHALSV